MTQQDKQIIIEVLTRILQENVGAKLSVALANGILMQLDQETAGLVKAAKEDDGYNL